MVEESPLVLVGSKTTLYAMGPSTGIVLVIQAEYEPVEVALIGIS
jgi:hypothetical protein